MRLKEIFVNACNINIFPYPHPLDEEVSMRKKIASFFFEKIDSKKTEVFCYGVKRKKSPTLWKGC